MQAQLKRTEIDVQQMIQDRETKMEEIKHSVQLNKVGEEVSDGRTTGLVAISLTLSSGCSGQCTEGDRGEHAGLLRAGEVHPEDSG